MSGCDVDSLVIRYRNGETEIIDEIIKNCYGLVRMESGKFYLEGGESDDLFQEGLFGLFCAIKTFDKDKSSFITYATHCIDNALKSAVRKYSAKTHSPLNNSTPIDELESSPSDTGDPEKNVIEGEDLSALKENVAEGLSSFELTVLSLRLNGLSYGEIASATDRSEKSVDNAVQRIRVKLRKIL